MKIFGKRGRNGEGRNNVASLQAKDTSSAIRISDLFSQTHALIAKDKRLFAGYAGWLLIIPLISFAWSFLNASETPELIADFIFTLTHFVLTLWATGCMIVLALARLRNTPITIPEVSLRATRALRALTVTGIFSFIAIIGGIYLLIIPGILAFVWLAFTKVLSVEHPEKTLWTLVVQSKQLSKGRFWNVGKKLLASFFVYGVLPGMLTLMLIDGILILQHSGLDAFLTQMLEERILPPWADLLISALSAPFIPFLTVYSVVLYEDLKNK